MSRTKKFHEMRLAAIDELWDMMESNGHLSNQKKAFEILNKVKHYWVFLDDDEKDFLDVAQACIEDKETWRY